MPTDSTVSNVLRLATAFSTREGAAEDRALYLTLLNSGIDEISANLPDGFDSHWNNTAFECLLDDPFSCFSLLI